MKSLQFVDLDKIEYAFRSEALTAKAEADHHGLKAIGSDESGYYWPEPLVDEPPSEEESEAPAGQLPKIA